MTFMSGHPGGARQKRRPGYPSHPGQMTSDQAHVKMADRTPYKGQVAHGDGAGGSAGSGGRPGLAGGSQAPTMSKQGGANMARLVAKLAAGAQKRKRLGQR